jgi:lysozyme
VAFLAPVDPILPARTLVTVEQAGQLIAEHEGQRLTTYRDSEGVRTIGQGFNLEAPGHRAMLKEMRINPRRGLTEGESDRLFRRKVEESLAACGRLFPDLGDLPMPVQLALVDMAYNLGATGLSQFRKLRAAIEERNWERAAGELLKSRWRHQVGWRAERLAGMIRECSGK